MKHRRRATAATVAPLTALALATTLLSGTANGAPLAAGSGTTAPVTGGTFGSGKPARTLTLVTGDKVTLDATGKVVDVSAARGREGTKFRITRTVGGTTFVVPRDAEPLLRDGTVDRRLFDVTQLVGLGHDDASRGDLPLIVTYAKGRTVAPSSFSSAGARVERDLPSVNGDAVSAPKAEGAALWRTLTGSGAARGSMAAATAAKVERIWLDGKVRASLDRSTAQIGAPSAWAAGFDGKGVKVAVLDTGVDTTHPDLKGQVVTAKNFSGSKDTVDRFGHGTHVASTVAGSGAKAGGTYRGVAPGARLISGKVLDDEGSGYDSDIIAGMQWAVAQGAKVINLSLGGQDGPETDPLEQAVNALSASSGALFVVAAGNEGPSAATVGTPGSAAAALTVGAVDRADAIAEFSSRGPTADGSLKPDLTAPGVDIVAAKAALSTDDPVADGYVAMSGTSMATPHVAGAAAILAQQHPDWSGARIKAALTSTAEPGAGLSPAEQGTGRTDLQRAVSQQVTAVSGALDFGTAQWPHADDKVLTEEVTYHNDGTAPVTLDLTAEAAGEDGKPAAEGMIAVTPSRITVPAGGTATATVTADTRRGTADGAFGGAVTAAAGDTRVRTAVAVTREAESYDLTVKHLNLKGRATRYAETGVNNLDAQSWQAVTPGKNGTATVRVPKGRYTLEGMVSTAPGTDDRKQALLIHPGLTVSRDTTVVLDAREADPVKITVPDPKAKHTDASVTFGVEEENGRSFGSTYELYGFEDIRVGQVGPKPKKGAAYTQYSGTWTRGSVNYRPAWIRRGDLTGFTAKLKQAQFARLNLSFGEPAKGKTLSVAAAPLLPDGNWIGPMGIEATLPHTMTDYVMPGMRWQYATQQLGAPDADGEPRWDSGLTLANVRIFRAGKTYTHRFNHGVFGPRMLTKGSGAAGAIRRGDDFLSAVALFSDGAGNPGDSAYSKARSTLHADGEKVFDVPAPLVGVTATLPAGQRTYRLTTDVSRPASLSAVSTRVTAEWTFRSAHVSGDAARWLPLGSVRFTPKLSASNTAKAGGVFTVPFTVEGTAGNRTARKLSFQVSYDDGKSWKKARVVDRKHLRLRHPAKAGTVSLRVSFTDTQGNTTRQTIHRAYRTTK
ncbi:S8 family peptidase [Streptomyces sp. NPDC014892]|uniref:S8 family peptidase n=1 Tax=Streptomyces sp. NPDC014892 TaxID=3364930 RepID=UPI0036FA50D7